MVAVKKYVKKQARRAAKVIKKRYTKRGAPLGLNVNQIAKDVMTLKKLVNAEKKRTDLTAGSFEAASFVGQLNVSTSGHQILDISPSSISQGVNYNQRNGNSIKLHSLVIKGQFIQNPNTNQRIRVAIDIFRRKNDIVSTATAMAQLYSPNQFINPATVYDYNSVRNPDYFNDYIKVASRRLTVASDSVAPQVSQVVNYTIPLKLNVHSKWNTAGNYEQSQFIMVIRCDSGNHGGSSGTFVNVPTNAPETGLYHANNWQYFFYDN